MLQKLIRFLGFTSLMMSGVLIQPARTQASFKDSVTETKQILGGVILNRVPYGRYRYECKFENSRVFLQSDNDQNTTAFWHTQGEIEDACAPTEDSEAGQKFWTHSFFRLNDHCIIRLPNFAGYFFKQTFRPKAVEKEPRIDRNFNPADRKKLGHTYKSEKAILDIDGEKIEGVCYEGGYQQGGAGSRGN